MPTKLHFTVEIYLIFQYLCNQLTFYRKYLTYQDVPHSKRLHFSWAFRRYFNIFSRVYTDGDMLRDSFVFF